MRFEIWNPARPASGLVPLFLSLLACGSLAAAPKPGAADSAEQSIRFLEQRVRDDPEDFIAHNRLAGHYLGRLRETGSGEYLQLAARAAKLSLDAVPAEFNPGGLAARARVEQASHDFAAARDSAKVLAEFVPAKSYPYEILGDALLELGDYDAAAAAYGRMRELAEGTVNTETRLSRLAVVRGQTDAAREHLDAALGRALGLSPPSPETVAWCRWQLGELAFSLGEYEDAEAHHRAALDDYPGYAHALASLGRVRAARGDLADAIVQYEQAVRIVPEIAAVAALGDLYRLSGREKDAAAQYALVEQIATLSAAAGVRPDRRLAMFYADHDLKPAEAYALAVAEYESRRDVYGADALAWTALKAGKLDEARAAAGEALRLGTRDASLFYHAGMVAGAGGDAKRAAELLGRALKLNPEFDPIHARVAREALAKHRAADVAE